MAAEHAFVQAIATIRPPLIAELFADITALGSVPVLSIVILGVWMTDRDDALLALAAVIPAGLITYALKVMVARPRPAVEHIVAVEPASFAFPSGHTTLAFAVAVLLARRNPSYAFYLYGVAALVAVSRVVIGVHYPSDIIAGAVIGTGIVLLVDRYSSGLLDVLPDSLR